MKTCEGLPGLASIPVLKREVGGRDAQCTYFSRDASQPRSGG